MQYQTPLWWGFLFYANDSKNNLTISVSYGLAAANCELIDVIFCDPPKLPPKALNKLFIDEQLGFQMTNGNVEKLALGLLTPTQKKQGACSKSRSSKVLTSISEKL